MTERARKILAGDPRALARAATAIENGDPSARPLLEELRSGSGRRALVVGVTGSPGAGKSTLVDALARAFRAQGRTLAIVAVDPSSERTGGAILGDRIRMQAHHADPGIFIRSMASRGAHGGLAEATADLIDLFRCSGRDLVIVETVGAGQAEVGIASLADLTLVVVVPGMGDDIQAIKAGILEIADVFAINKADRPGVAEVENQLRAESSAPIFRTVATDGTGVGELAAAVAVFETRGRIRESRTVYAELAAHLSRQLAMPVRLRSITIEVPAPDEARVRLERAAGDPDILIESLQE